MVRRLAACRKSPTRFRDPPWNDQSIEWQEINARLASDDLARKISNVVETLDLGEIEQSYMGQGSSPYPPELIIKAILYEVRCGRQSPAQWYRDAKGNDAMKWLLRGFQPSRSRWYAIRDRLAPWVDRLNEQVLKRAVAEGLTTAENASLDGTLLASRASRHQLAGEKKLLKRLDELNRVMAEDKAGLPAASVPSWMAKRHKTRVRQHQRYEAAQRRMAELQAENASRIPSRRRERSKIVVSVSDPESAIGPDKHKVFRPLYNIQFAPDLDSRFILAYDVFGQSSDAGTYAPMLDRAEQFTGCKLKKVAADATYATAANLAISQRRDVILYAPWQENDFTTAKKKPDHERQLPKSEFEWLYDQQVYRCPAGHKLKYVGRETRQRAGDETTVYLSYQCSPQHCRGCPLSKRCVKNPNSGRRIRRNEHEELIEAHKQRMETPEAKTVYRKRKQTVELAFADTKQHRGLRTLPGYGPKLAKLQAGLIVLVHNLLQWLSSGQPPPRPSEPLPRSPQNTGEKR